MSDPRVFQDSGTPIDGSSGPFHVAETLKLIVGFGTFVIAGLMAREAAKEGVDLFEDKVNGTIEKIEQVKNRKKTPPPSAK